MRSWWRGFFKCTYTHWPSAQSNYHIRNFLYLETCNNYFERMCLSQSLRAHALLSQKPTKGFCEADSQHMRSLGNKMGIYAAHGGFIRDSRALAAREDDNNPWELRRRAIKRGITRKIHFTPRVATRRRGTLEINERPDLKACEWSVKLLTLKIN